jgi:threonine/homoserine/homoserine lactone efflux protein
VTKYAGAAYLIFLGVQKLRERPPADGASRGSTAPNPSYRKLYWQGVLVNVLNPKTALFFFAFLPQFVDPARGAVSLQIVVLGCFFATLGLLSDGTYAIASAAVASRLRGRGSALRFLAGGAYVALGLAAAIGGRTPQSTKA